MIDRKCECGKQLVFIQESSEFTPIAKCDCGNTYFAENYLSLKNKTKIIKIGKDVNIINDRSTSN